jgi:hypothetical protein
MSFGFGVGDFLAVTEFATKIRKELAGAPSQYRALSDEVKNLSVLIQHVEAETTGVDPVLVTNVKNAKESSKSVLHDLHAFIEKNKIVSSKKSLFYWIDLITRSAVSAILPVPCAWSSSKARPSSFL